MYDIFIMDLGGHSVNVSWLQKRFPHAQVVRYYGTHFDTIRRCATRARTPFFWVLASCCDYRDFNFDYRAVPWEAYQIHCWASGTEKFGDTFLIPTDEFKQQQAQIELLEWYRDINWHPDGVKRLMWPLHQSSHEHVTRDIINYSFKTPYVWINAVAEFDPPLWKNRVCYSFNKSNSVSLVPRDITGSLATQIYDYPYTTKQKSADFVEKPLDIIYISNGEPDEEHWYQHLSTVTKSTPTWVRGVNGRSAAYRAAATASTTPWFFAVFAKLEVSAHFDWTWQPDYWQEPKHYIFNARNPVNGLEYGHMGMIAYNRDLVLSNSNPGLDFTLSQPHASVPIFSGTAHYNQDPWTTWRTAFREVIKLRYTQDTAPTVETGSRLRAWFKHNDTAKFAEWSTLGAQDASVFYDEAAGDYQILMQSFEWDFLRHRFTRLHKSQ